MRTGPILLSLDTTSSSGSVALLQEGRLLAEVNSDSASTFSERLLAAVDYALKSQSLTVQDVDVFALAAGPGSFTGIRIGVSTVKSLAEASSRPVVPVSSLEALAMKLHQPGSRLLCPMIDAKKGEVYAALFEVKTGHLQEIFPQGAYTPDYFFSRLPQRRKIAFLGNGVISYREKILDYFRDRAYFPSRSLFIAYEVGRIGYRIFKQNRAIQGKQVEPIYFRKSQAEEEHR